MGPENKSPPKTYPWATKWAGAAGCTPEINSKCPRNKISFEKMKFRGGGHPEN